MAVTRNGVISMDCADPAELGEFWAAMLGGEIEAFLVRYVGHHIQMSIEDTERAAAFDRYNERRSIQPATPATP